MMSAAPSSSWPSTPPLHLSSNPPNPSSTPPTAAPTPPPYSTSSHPHYAAPVEATPNPDYVAAAAAYTHSQPFIQQKEPTVGQTSALLAGASVGATMSGGGLGVGAVGGVSGGRAPYGYDASASMRGGLPAADVESSPFGVRLYYSLNRMGSHYLSKTIVYVKSRWLGFFSLIFLYVCRVYFRGGFFIVSYGLGIFLLNLLIGFLSPQVDPESQVGLGGDVGDDGEEGEESMQLPVRDAEEYRPFQRRLPEYKFWLSGSRAVLIALVMTFFNAFDLPVFWPILLIYFLLLFFLTMKQQIKRMIKYRYLPFSWGKQTYGDITRKSGK
eukprot:GHVQ01006992.1.p1 GENE.GHVQ01006992.1~~GHVQ01006992.1.p1  ORF type:complete len:326 (+),score=64.95 GHVQ01006992.1:263-1240(+)